MSFRIRLLLSFTAAVAVTALLVTWIAAYRTRRAFEKRDHQRTAALVNQFRREFARRGEEVARTIDGIAAAEDTLRMAIELGRPDADAAAFVNQAAQLAAAHRLDFLEIVSHDGTIVSSAQWPAHFGYPAAWVKDAAGPAFVRLEELPEETVLALVAVRAVTAGERPLYVSGGYRLDQRFLESIVLPAGMRATLSRSGSVPAPDPMEAVETIPLTGRNQELLGTLVVASSRRELAALVAGIRRTGFFAAGIGILLGAALSIWAAARITRPVERLAAGARQVAQGDWNVSVEVATRDELAQLAAAFNTMTAQLIEQRDRLVQAERVAAWREIARRLAHELKNPLFPLQITVENLQRAKECAPEMFDEVFRESTETLLAELGNLKKILSRFSDFAKMPAPQLEAVDLNEVVSKTLRLFEPQFRQAGRPIEPVVEYGEVGTIQADPEQLGRALQNLVLNAIDAMPAGGTLSVRTARQNGTVTLELSDTGQGLTAEECERLFTPYYTTKQHGTGLGLAIVQSVVSDHKGRISVASRPGHGASFRIELPA